MKKVFAILAIAALASCGGSDTTATEAAAVVDSTASAMVDSAAVVVDSAAAKVDSAAKAVVDTLKK